MDRRTWLMAMATATALVTSTAAPALALPSPTGHRGPVATAPQARAPFGCAGDILLAAGDTATQLYEGETGPGEISFSALGSATERYNGMGVNPDDEYLYAIDRTDRNLLRVDDTGAVTDLGSVGLPAPLNSNTYASGAFDDAGNYFVAGGYDNRLYRVDIAAKTSTLITLSETFNGVIDFAYSGGYLWGANRSGSIVRIDPATGTVTAYPDTITVGDYGGTFTYGNGDLGFFSNSGTIRRISLTNPANPTFSELSSQTAPAMSAAVDASSCFQMPVDLAVAKTGPAEVSAGGTVSYSIKVTNNGPNASSGWTLTDTVPAGLTNAATTTDGCAIAAGKLSCTGGALAVDASTTIALTGKAAADVTSIVNTATVFGNDPDPDPDNNDSTVTTTVKPSVDLAVVKTGPPEITAGGAVSYSIKVTNNGPSDSTGWTLTDAIPAELRDAATSTPGCSVTGGNLTCTGGALPAGASTTLTLTGIAASDAGRITNTAKVTGKEPDPDPDNNESTTTTATERRVDLAVTKTGPATVAAGGDITYTLKVTNNGPSDATGWGLNDPVPAGLQNAATSTPECSITGGELTCISGPLAVGASKTITLTGTAAPNATSIANTAVVEGNDPDPDPGNNEAKTTTDITSSVDLAVTKTGPATVTAGGEITYTLKVTNNGPSDSTGWTLSDPLPSGLRAARTTTAGCAVAAGTLSCTGGALAVGDSTTITLTSTAAPDARTIDNAVTVDGNEPDPDPGNNEDEITTDVTPSVDLAVTKTGPATVTAGGEITYSLKVTDNGPSDSTGWTLTDPIPAGLQNAATSTPGCSVTGGNLTCTGGALAVGDSETVTLTGTAATNATSITNTAKVTGKDPDPEPGNNEDETTTTVSGKPGLTIAKKQEGPAKVKAGADVRYTITVTNTGTTAYTEADPASFTDDLTPLLDDGRYAGDAKATRGTVTYDAPELTWTGALQPGQSAIITFTLKTNYRTFGDLKLDNTVVSDTPGTNCPARTTDPRATDPRCTTHGKVIPKDKGKDYGNGRK
ncbi:DUF11 domain-containing protein [Streptomyces sp. NPDC048290]|uniref:DUF11 domain-containing protein n=1 Tax=Streptomyces sp. NPDC048290 TaxID=3155811 RepID=UPI00342C8A08